MQKPKADFMWLTEDRTNTETDVLGHFWFHLKNFPSTPDEQRAWGHLGSRLFWRSLSHQEGVHLDGVSCFHGSALTHQRKAQEGQTGGCSHDPCLQAS